MGVKEKRIYRHANFSIGLETGYWDCGSMTYVCQFYSALHFLCERNRKTGSTLSTPKFSECCSDGQVIPHFLHGSACLHCSANFSTSGGQPRPSEAGETCSSCGNLVPKILPSFSEPPHLLQELLSSNLAEARHFRKNIRHWNSALAMASVRADFVARGPGVSRYNPTVTVHGKMYHERGALIPPTGKKPRFAAVYIQDTEQAAQNRKHSYGVLREELLYSLGNFLQESNRLVLTFVSIRDLIQTNPIPEEVKLVIHAHERTKTGHERKYNVPEASEIAALIIGEQYGALEIVLRRKGHLNVNGHEKLDMIRLVNHMYDRLCYPLRFPFGNDGWHSKLMHLDKKGSFRKYHR